MTDTGCPCGGRCIASEERVAARETDTVSQRSLLSVGGALAVFLLDRLPDAVLARTLSKKFHPPAGSRKVGSLKKMPAGSALATTDPASGDPAVVIRVSAKKKV